MKSKNVLIGLAILSTLAFANGKNYYKNSHFRDDDYCHSDNYEMRRGNMMENVGMMANNYMNEDDSFHGRFRNRDLPKDLETSLTKKRITIQELQLSIKKLLLEKNVDWNKINQKNQEIANLKAEMLTEIQKFMYLEKNN